MKNRIGRPSESYDKYINEKFGKLLLLEVLGKDKNSIVRVKVSCSCGVIKKVRLSDLKSGRTVSCGCHKKKAIINALTTHGGKGTRIYNIWCSMKERCLNKNCKSFPDYGGRGIVINPEWLDFAKFRSWSEINGYNKNLSIDRIDNDKGYSPDNCRWANAYTQANNKRSSVKLELNGKTLSVAEWAREKGIDQRTIHDRIFKLGWSIEKAINKPVRKMRPSVKPSEYPN